MRDQEVQTEQEETLHSYLLWRQQTSDKSLFTNTFPEMLIRNAGFRALNSAESSVLAGRHWGGSGERLGMPRRAGRAAGTGR